MLDFSQIPVLFFLLLPVIVVFLWLQFRSRQKHKNRQHSLSSEYFKGLNYLLNDEQDKALDVFVKLVETNWDTIDTHFALGKIYRKNGEMDKAIKIHQGLIGRPTLPEKYRSKILLELGFDYLGAGWFDRAEGLFKEVLIEDPQSESARHNLVLIYQQEKDWFKAIDVGVSLYKDKPELAGPMVAQYYCELAEIARQKGDVVQLKNNAKQALDYDADCVRASILLAEQAEQDGDDDIAIRYYQQIETQDAESIILVMQSMQGCFQRLGRLTDFLHYLEHLEQEHEALFLQVTHAEVLEKLQGKQEAAAYLSGKLKQQPTLESMQKLLSYKSSEVDTRLIYSDLDVSMYTMQQDRMHYRCRHCGLQTNTHYWLCPGCNQWGKIKTSIGETCKTSRYEKEHNHE